MHRASCSECGSHDTERVHTEWLREQIAETRVCHDCPAEFVNKFDLYAQETQSGGPRV